jgi:hypothetical protein
MTLKDVNSDDNLVSNAKGVGLLRVKWTHEEIVLR